MSQEIKQIIDNYKGRRECLIMMLQDIQQKHNYLPEKSLRVLSDSLDVPLTKIYAIATYYKSFSLTPKGKHLIQVCLGTACHVRNAMKVLETFERELDIKCGETDGERNFTLEDVRCVGCCGLAPVVTIDEELYGDVKATQVSKILKNIHTAGLEV